MRHLVQNKPVIELAHERAPLSLGEKWRKPCREVQIVDFGESVTT